MVFSPDEDQFEHKLAVFVCSSLLDLNGSYGTAEVSGTARVVVPKIERRHAFDRRVRAHGAALLAPTFRSGRASMEQGQVPSGSGCASRSRQSKLKVYFYFEVSASNEV